VPGLARILDTPILTSVCDTRRLFFPSGVKVQAIVPQQIWRVAADHRASSPVACPLFSARTVDDDVMICSTAGWSHGVGAAGPAVAYGHSPHKGRRRTEDY
jgi:hypothetical protein